MQEATRGVSVLESSTTSKIPEMTISQLSGDADTSQAVERLRLIVLISNVMLISHEERKQLD